MSKEPPPEFVKAWEDNEAVYDGVGTSPVEEEWASEPGDFFRAGRLAGIEEAAKVAEAHELDGPGCSCVAAADECFEEIAAAIRALAEEKK